MPEHGWYMLHSNTSTLEANFPLVRAKKIHHWNMLAWLTLWIVAIRWLPLRPIPCIWLIPKSLRKWQTTRANCSIGNLGNVCIRIIEWIATRYYWRIVGEVRISDQPIRLVSASIQKFARGCVRPHIWRARITCGDNQQCLVWFPSHKFETRRAMGSTMWQSDDYSSGNSNIAV